MLKLACHHANMPDATSFAKNGESMNHPTLPLVGLPWYSSVLNLTNPANEGNKYEPIRSRLGQASKVKLANHCFVMIMIIFVNYRLAGGAWSCHSLLWGVHYWDQVVIRPTYIAVTWAAPLGIAKKSSSGTHDINVNDHLLACYPSSSLFRNTLFDWPTANRRVILVVHEVIKIF